MVVSGLLAWLIVSVPVGLSLAVWGFGLRRQGFRVGRWLMVWGLAGPFLVPVATAVTWLIAGESAPNAGHEPWPWYATAATYSTVLTLVVAVALVCAAWASKIARIGVGDGSKQ